RQLDAKLRRGLRVRSHRYVVASGQLPQGVEHVHGLQLRVLGRAVGRRERARGRLVRRGQRRDRRGRRSDRHDGGARAAVYMFRRSGTSWAQRAYVKATNTGADDWLGYRVGVSRDGGVLAASAIREDGAATGVGGASDDAAMDSGAVYILE